MVTMTSRWRAPSARRPITGVASAPVSSAAVSTHWAVLRVTPSVWAMVGISGAPETADDGHQQTHEDEGGEEEGGAPFVSHQLMTS